MGQLLSDFLICAHQNFGMGVCDGDSVSVVSLVMEMHFNVCFTIMVIVVICFGWYKVPV